MNIGGFVHATEEDSPLQSYSENSILISSQTETDHSEASYFFVEVNLLPSMEQMIEIVENPQEDPQTIFQLSGLIMDASLNWADEFLSDEERVEAYIEDVSNVFFKGIIYQATRSDLQEIQTSAKDPQLALADDSGTIEQDQNMTTAESSSSVLVANDQQDLNLIEAAEETKPTSLGVFNDNTLHDALKDVSFSDPHEVFAEFSEMVSQDESGSSPSLLVASDDMQFDQPAPETEEAEIDKEQNDQPALADEKDGSDSEKLTSQEPVQSNMEQASSEEDAEENVLPPELRDLYEEIKTLREQEKEYVFNVDDGSTETIEKALEVFSQPPQEDKFITQLYQADVPKYMQGEFIVKFKSNWPDGLDGCAHCILAQGSKFQSYIHDGSSSIDELNRICKVKGAKSLFFKRHGMRTQDAKFQLQKKREKIRKRFKKRSRHIPENYHAPDLINTYVFEIPKEYDVEKVAALYAADPHVEYAHPNRLVTLKAFPQDDPNDTYYASLQYALNNIGQTGGTHDADIDAREAWPTELGDGIIVAILDTGIDWDHLDLADQIWSNTDEVENGVDSDGNGYIDDIRGYDFTECAEVFLGLCLEEKEPDNDPDDDIDHGTHVAGIAGAVGNNGLGVIGVAPEITLMPVKAMAKDVLVGGSGTEQWLADGLIYAANNGADVINNSWGCGCPGGCASPTIEAAVEHAYSLGVVIVFAAGNDSGCNIDDDSPQNMDETITVSSTDHNDQLSSFSNIGNVVNVSAPGSSIYSTLPYDSIGAFSGTSMAAPHVAGLAALLLAEHSSLTNEQIRLALEGTADDLGAAGFDTSFGYGRINAQEALSLERVKPFLSSIGNKTTSAGTLLQINVSATDPNSDSLTMTATLLGGASVTTIGAAFTDNGNGTGVFNWTPTGGQVGLNPSVVFTATDAPAGFADDETITITVTGTAFVCGDGTEDPGEECDDGNTTAGDGCSPSCTNEICGNQIIDPGEECDDNNTMGGDGCGPTCLFEVCGNNFTDTAIGEDCDDGGTVGGDGCGPTCLFEVCGNDFIDTAIGENCDDGNTTSGDGCSATCQKEFVCGNGVSEPGEECDDGNTLPGDGCSAFCKQEFCGNGITDPGEECDGSSNCTADCQIMDDAFCGDGVCNVDVNETCVSCQEDCGYCRGLRPR